MSDHDAVERVITMAWRAHTEGETNDFEDAVRAVLLDRGFEVDAQVGASQYRIDLAVRDRRDRTRYVLGIECDGAGYHSSRTARDRDLLRQQVLHGMGWRIHRVWSTEWFYERNQAIAGILRSIEQAESRPIGEGVHAPASEHLDEVPPARPPAKPIAVERKYQTGIPYELYRPTQRLDRDHLLQRSYTGVLARTIGELVAVEGPIHHDFMVERLKDLHSIERAGSNIQTNIKSAVRQAKRWGTLEYEPRSPFYHAPQRAILRFRTCANDVSRSVEYIAPQELALAVLHLVEDQFGLVEERAPSAVARLFGIERLWSESADTIRSVIDDLVSRGTLRRNGMQLYLA